MKQTWWCTPVISTLYRLRREGRELEISLGYRVRLASRK